MFVKATEGSKVGNVKIDRIESVCCVVREFLALIVSQYDTFYTYVKSKPA
jgi:hypothetical protein